MKTKDKLYDLRQTIDDLVAIGPGQPRRLPARGFHPVGSFWSKPRCIVRELHVVNVIESTVHVLHGEDIVPVGQLAVDVAAADLPGAGASAPPHLEASKTLFLERKSSCLAHCTVGRMCHF